MTDFCVTLWELSSMPAVQSFCLGIALLVAGAFLLRDSEPDNGVLPPKGKADSDLVAWRNAQDDMKQASHGKAPADRQWDEMSERPKLLNNQGKE